MEKLGLLWNKRIFMAISILSVPFLIRAIYNFLAAILHLDAHVMIPSIKRDDWVAPIIYLAYISLVDILPITGQLISMLVVLDNSGWTRTICMKWHRPVLRKSEVFHMHNAYKCECGKSNISFYYYSIILNQNILFY